MPIYEYFCYDCRKRVSVFFRTFSEATTTRRRSELSGGESAPAGESRGG